MILSLCFIFESGIIVFKRQCAENKTFICFVRRRTPAFCTVAPCETGREEATPRSQWSSLVRLQSLSLTAGVPQAFQSCLELLTTWQLRYASLLVALGTLLWGNGCRNYRLVKWLIQRLALTGCESPHQASVCLMWPCCMHALKSPFFNLFCLLNNPSIYK